MDSKRLRELTGATASEIAQALGLKSHSTIVKWSKGKRIPAGHVLTLEKLYGIPREQLRPDLYAPRHDGRRAQKGAA